jgi:hypothetical protein
MGFRMACWMPAISCLLALAGAAFAVAPNDVTCQGRLLDPVVRLDALQL